MLFNVKKLVGTKSPKPIVANAIKQKYAASRKLQFSQAEKIAAPIQMYASSKNKTIPTGMWQCSRLFWCCTLVVLLVTAVDFTL